MLLLFVIYINDLPIDGEGRRISISLQMMLKLSNILIHLRIKINFKKVQQVAGMVGEVVVEIKH